MSVVIPTSQMVLMRTRKQVQKIIASGEWAKLADMEHQLFQEINRAVDDPQRASKELLAELGSVISIYKELTALCHYYTNQIVR